MTIHVVCPVPLSDFVVLDTSEIPTDARRFLALVLSPSFEIGMLAAQAGGQEAQPEDEGSEQYQYISADTALVVMDSLLTAFPLLLPHVSLDCMEREAARVVRLQNAHQASAQTLRRQRRHEEKASAQEPPVITEGADDEAMAR